MAKESMLSLETTRFFRMSFLRGRIWHWGKIWPGGCGDSNPGAVLDDLIDTEKKNPSKNPSPEEDTSCR
jgi:hypothetical protein